MGLIKNLLSRYFMPQEIKTLTHEDQPQTVWSTVGSNLIYQVKNWPFNPDQFIRKKGFATIDLMRDDETIKSSLTVKKLLRLNGWTITPPVPREDLPQLSPSVRKLVLDLTGYVQYVLARMQGSMNSYLLEMMTAMDYGFSVTEKVYTLYKSGAYAGKIGLAWMKVRYPHDFDFRIDQYGNLLADGVQQRQASVYKNLPKDKFVVFTWNREFDNWYGQSDLKSAYRAFWSKNHIIRFWNVFLERFGMPLVVGKYGPGVNRQARTDLDAILKDVQAKTAMSIPEGIDISFLEAMRRGESGYQDAIQAHDAAMVKALLYQTLATTEGKRIGSYALARVHFETLLGVLQNLGEFLEDEIIGEQIIRPLIDMNYPVADGAAFAHEVDSLYPKFKFHPLVPEDVYEVAKIWVDAVSKGATRNVSEDDDNHFRRLLQFPPAVIAPTKQVQNGPPDTDVTAPLPNVSPKQVQKLSSLMIEDLLATITKKWNLYQQDSSEVNKLQVRYVGELRDAFADIGFEESDAFARAGIIKDTLLERARSLIYKEIINGSGMGEAIGRINVVLLGHINKVLSITSGNHKL